MRTLFSRIFIALLLSTILSTVLTSSGVMNSEVRAQQWIPNSNIQELYDPDDISCTNAYNYIDEQNLQAKEQKKKQYEACREGYVNHDKADYCKNKNYGSTSEGKSLTRACEAGSDRHGDPGVKFCAARHAMGTSADPQNTMFRACYDGFKNGEGVCNIHHPESDPAKKPQRDACLEGVRGGMYVNGAVASTNSDTDLSQKPDILGKAPESVDMNELVAGKNEIATREKCSIEGFFGNLMCGFLDMMGNMADASLVLLGSFMKVDMLTTNPDDPIFTYWKIFRTFANVIFIIALLVIVASHISGVGLSAYSLQKMVPRLVVGAMLINISFFASAVAVDVSNIVGSTVYDTMKNAIAPQPDPDSPEQNEDRLQVEMRSTTLTNPEDGSELSWRYLTRLMAYVAPVSAVAGTGMIMNGGLAALLPVIVSVVLAVMIVVICLLLRQVLIIVFVIISPLAFAAFLLPNTKSLFDRWLKSFIPLLMLFPVIAFTFGIGAIVSEIMLAAAFAKTGFIAKSLFILVALAVQVIPLLATPKLMAMGGGLLAQLSNAARGKTSGLNSKAKEYAQKQKKLGDKKTATNPKWYNKHRRMRADHEAKNKIADHSLEQAQSTQTSAYKAAAAGPQVADSAPSPQATEAAAPATNTQPATPTDTTESTDLPDARVPTPPNTDAAAPADAPTNNDADDGYDAETAKEVHVAVAAKTDRVKARSARFGSEHTERNDVLAIATLKNAASTNTDIEGAIMHLASVGDMGAIVSMLKVSGQMNPSQRQTLVKSIKASGAGAGAAPMLNNPEVLENIQNGNVNAENFASTVIAPSLRKDDYSPETMTTLDQDMAKEVFAAVENPQANNIPEADANDVISATDIALRTESTARRIGKQKDSLVAIQALRRPPNAS